MGFKKFFGETIIHFRQKSDLTTWLIKNCPRKAIVRALINGAVELYGGFRYIPPSNFCGWILKVTSIHGKSWNIAVLSNETKHKYEIRIVSKIPWKNWAGVFQNQKLFQGDHPEKYKELYKNGHCCK